MKRLGIFIGVVFWSLGALAQSSGKCLTESETNKAMLTDQHYAEGLGQLELMADSFASHPSSVPARDDIPTPTVTIPIVVHVLYRLEENNISFEQIQSQIDVVNRDFAMANLDLDKVPEAFRGLASGTRIRFELADQDPDGRFTHGVTRTKTAIEDIGSQAIYHRPERGGVAPWTQPHYLNVWVCELEGNGLGFALLPGSTMSERDGIVMSPRAFGTLGTAQEPYNEGRTFVHEVGHYFGLRHLWGSNDQSCSSTDYMSDTPAQLKENFGCKKFPVFSCPGESDGDMFMNYMDYGNDSCMLLFTNRQAEYMHLVLTTSRKTLYHSEGVTSVTETAFDSPAVKLYPNPTDALVHIELPESLLGQPVVIYDMTGSEVMRRAFNQRINRIDVQGLRPGTYIIETGTTHQPLIIF